jgi:hypothetical protein
MAKWDPNANGVDEAQKCFICGKKFPANELRIYHALVPGYLHSHRVVDRACAERLLEDQWAACGCGG